MNNFGVEYALIILESHFSFMSRLTKKLYISAYILLRAASAGGEEFQFPSEHSWLSTLRAISYTGEMKYHREPQQNSFAPVAAAIRANIIANKHQVSQKNN